MSERQYKVFKIENGTVIDHIVSPMALKIVELLNLSDDGIVSIGMNFGSQKCAKKDIIKIENVILDKTTTDLIALISPEATINIIKDFNVIEKRKIEMPEKITSVMKCPNPMCVTNKYHDCDTKFEVIGYDGNFTMVRCDYCERENPVKPSMLK